MHTYTSRYLAHQLGDVGRQQIRGENEDILLSLLTSVVQSLMTQQSTIYDAGFRKRVFLRRRNDALRTCHPSDTVVIIPAFVGESGDDETSSYMETIHGDFDGILRSDRSEQDSMEDT